MQDRRSSERGFSLTETLTVVAIVGIVALITLPAMLQLMPQYRIRSAASDAGSGLRLIRQKAITTRSPWRASFDAGGERYKFSRLKAANLARNNSANWQDVHRDGRPATSEQWIRGSAIDIRTNTTNAFKDVDGDGHQDIIFLRDGSVARDGDFSTPLVPLTFTTLPTVVFAADNSFIRFNRYYLALDRNGKLSIRPVKE